MKGVRAEKLCSIGEFKPSSPVLISDPCKKGGQNPLTCCLLSSWSLIFRLKICRFHKFFNMGLDLLHGKFKSPWQPTCFSYLMDCQEFTDRALKTYVHVCDVKVPCRLILK